MKIATLLPSLLLSSLLPLAAPAQKTEPLKSRAEQTSFEETSRYDDVVHFFCALQQRSPLMRVEVFGHTQEGRAMPLVILADPPVSQPIDARASGKPIIFIMANIHAGEVEGKEAMQTLAQRILTGDLHPLLDKLIILIAPIYNADGNEKISMEHRTDQNGPIGGVGVRENSQGLDLNRDYVKMEAPETRALIRLFNRWDPLLTVDLHTTDGSYHAYHLTYSIPLNPSLDTELLAYHRDKMMPAIEKAMLSKHKYRTYYYGNFSGPAPKPGEPEQRKWMAFSQQPRAGQNYIGFRNRLTILSEAYSHLDFKGRVEVTEAFVEEIFKYAAEHAGEIRKLTSQADTRTIERGLTNPPVIGVEYEPKALPKPVEILVGGVVPLKNARSGVDMVAMVEDKATPAKMLDYGLFAATRSVPTAEYYIFPPEPALKVVLEKLRGHGIAVEELTAPLTTEVEVFEIGTLKKAPRPFQKHTEVRLTGTYKKETMNFPGGTIVVRAAQPLGLLAAYLLEPESDDGLVTWNFLDPYLEPGKSYPILKVMHDEHIASRLLEE